MVEWEILFYGAGGERPKYDHDCPNCRFIRNDSLKIGDRRIICDVYLCKNPNGDGATLLFRHSNEPGEYYSYCNLSIKSMIIQAGIETLRRGYIKEDRLSSPSAKALDFACWQGKFTFEFLDEETEYPMW